MQQFFQAFPNLRATVHEMVAEGDLVVTRVTCQGTHKGKIAGAALMELGAHMPVTP